MKRRITFILFYVIFTTTLFSQSSSNKELVEEWLMMDKQLINETYFMLSNIPDIDSLLTTYKFFRQENDDKFLGLGYKLIHLRKNGGYSYMQIRLLINSTGKIFRSEIDIEARSEIIKMLNDEYNLLSISGAYIISKEYRPSHVIIKHLDTNLYNDFLNDFKYYFGFLQKINVPESIVNEYYLLTDPFCENVYGYLVGFGFYPDARIALDKILTLNNCDAILLAIVASPNPEGRIYAIEGLFRNNIEEITNENKYTELLRKTAALNVKIFVEVYDIGSRLDINTIESIRETIKYSDNRQEVYEMEMLDR